MTGPAKSTVPVEGIYDNVSQVLINTTEDKLRLVITEFVQAHDRSWRSVAPPLGIIVTLVAAILTSTPDEQWLSWWYSVYGGGTFAAGFWLIRTLWEAFRSRDKSMSIEDLVERIKGDL